MYHANTLRIAMLAALLLASPGVQAGARKASIQLPRELQAAGTTLAQGTYVVQWETHSPEATVTLVRDKKTAATVQGRVEIRQESYSRNTVVYENSAEGPPRLKEIRFAGKREVLIFD